MRFPTSVRAAVCALALLLSTGALAANKKEAAVTKYPNATRAEPNPEMAAGDQKDFNKAADLVNENKNDEAEQLVQKVLANEKASKYAQAFAHQLQAQIDWEKDKSADAIAEYKKAVELNALPNDAHFQVLYQIAQLQVQDEKYADALATLDQWTKETGSETADELALKANA